MGIFVDTLRAAFPAQADDPLEILKTESHPIRIQSLVVCNRGPQPIKFNLKIKSVEAQTTTPTETFCVNEFEIKPYRTATFTSHDPDHPNFIDIYLEYRESPSIIESLISFTNGPTQIYDCRAIYSVIKELPITA